MKKFDQLISGRDLRSIGQANKILPLVRDQSDFDELFNLLSHSDPKVVMRSADAIEKISIDNPRFLKKHKKQILAFIHTAVQIQLKWHLALIVSRLKLTGNELGIVWKKLTDQAMDQKESRIVRVNSVQGLFNLIEQNKDLKVDFLHTVSIVQRENIPSMNARLRHLIKGGIE